MIVCRSAKFRLYGACVLINDKIGEWANKSGIQIVFNIQYSRKTK